MGSWGDQTESWLHFTGGVPPPLGPLSLSLERGRWSAQRTLGLALFGKKVRIGM